MTKQELQYLIYTAVTNYIMNKNLEDQIIIGSKEFVPELIFKVDNEEFTLTITKK